MAFGMCRADASPARFLGSATGAVALHADIVGRARRPPFVIRHSSFLILLIVCFFQFSGSAKAFRALAPFCSHSGSPGCIGAKKGRRRAKKDRNLRPDSPDDLDAANGGLDVGATTSPRHDQDAPHFTEAGVSITLRAPSFVSLRQPSRLPHNSCLREHVRERAPPSLG